MPCTWVGEIALAVLVLRETGSAAAVAGVFLAAHLAPAVTAPLALTRLERLSTARALAVLLGAQTVLFALLAAFATSLPLPLVLGVAALDGVAAVTGRALIKASIVATTRPAGLLREGNAVFSAVFTWCAAGGPFLGGLVVAALGPAAGLALDAGSFAAAAMLLAARNELPSVSHDAADPLHAVQAGIAHLRRNLVLRRLVVFNAAVTLFGAAIVPVEVVFVTETLGAGEAAYGAVLTAWGVGMVLGSLLVFPLRRIEMMTLVVASTFITAVAYIGMGSSSTVAAVCVFSALGGVANGIEAYALMTAMQERTDERFQARVGGLIESLAAAAVGSGFLVGGVVATIASPRAAYGLAGAGLLVALGPATVALRPARRRTAVAAA